MSLYDIETDLMSYLDEEGEAYWNQLPECARERLVDRVANGERVYLVAEEIQEEAELATA